MMINILVYNSTKAISTLPSVLFILNKTHRYSRVVVAALLKERRCFDDGLVGGALRPFLRLRARHLGYASIAKEQERDRETLWAPGTQYRSDAE